jgi:hypothetical protein
MRHQAGQWVYQLYGRTVVAGIHGLGMGEPHCLHRLFDFIGFQLPIRIRPPLADLGRPIESCPTRLRSYCEITRTGEQPQLPVAGLAP